MNTDSRRWALVGPLTVAAWIAGVGLLNHNGPTDHASGSAILAWYASNTDRILLGGWLVMLGCLGFLIVVSGIRQRLATAVGPTSQLPGLALAGAALTTLSGILIAAVDVAGAVNKNDISPGVAATFHHSTDIFFIAAEMAAIVPLAVIAIGAWRTQIFPRWWAGFGGLVAIVLLVGPIGWMGLIFGLPIWTLGTSLFVLLRSPSRFRGIVPAV